MSDSMFVTIGSIGEKLNPKVVEIIKDKIPEPDIFPRMNSWGSYGSTPPTAA